MTMLRDEGLEFPDVGFPRGLLQIPGKAQALERPSPWGSEQSPVVGGALDGYPGAQSGIRGSLAGHPAMAVLPLEVRQGHILVNPPGVGAGKDKSRLPQLAQLLHFQGEWVVHDFPNPGSMDRIGPDPEVIPVQAKLLFPHGKSFGEEHGIHDRKTLQNRGLHIQSGLTK